MNPKPLFIASLAATILAAMALEGNALSLGQAGVAMNEFILSDILNCRECYETENEWQDYKAKKTKKREDWENKILQKFGFVKNDKNSVCIAENVSEIFTVVIMERLENGEEDGR